jgi:hypothetical protein
MPQLIKIKHLSADGAFAEFWLTLAHTTMPENSGNLYLALACVHVRKALAAVVLQVFTMRNIVGCGHVIPEIATSSMTEDSQNERWIVNCHIAVATWNDVSN